MDIKISADPGGKAGCEGGDILRGLSKGGQDRYYAAG